jgi:hypothetical protein
MPELRDYVDLAITRHGLRGVKHLNAELGFARSELWHYLRGARLIPAAKIALLAEKAGIDLRQAMIDRASWGAVREVRTSTAFEVELAALKTAAKAFVFAFGVFVSNSNAQAAELQENNLAAIAPNLYIMRYLEMRSGTQICPQPPGIATFPRPRPKPNCASNPEPNHDRYATIAATSGDHGAAARPERRLSLGS